MDQVVIPLRHALIFVVVLARVGGLVTFAPFWSHAAQPTKVRVVLAFVLALVITPIVAPQLPTPPTSFAGLVFVVVCEVLTGCALGFVGRLVFTGLEMAAQIITYQMGFSLASTIDPATQAHTAAFGTIAQMIGLMILLAGDGHHWILAATIKSFRTVAPGGFTMTPALAEVLVRLSADALAVGVALAAPAIILLLMVELALAIVGRAAPQIQVMITGFPVKIAVGLWLIGASLYFMPAALRTALGGIHEGLQRALAAM